MNAKLAHLPTSKQEDLKEILDIILEVVKPEKVILFGSHATGRWVEDEYVENGATYSYMSDYDLLVVINKEDKDKELEIVSKIENRTMRFKNDVSPIVHTIEYVNKGLEIGQYFFRDIVAEGVVLFDTDNYQFAEARVLTKEEERGLADQYFKKWIKSGSRFLNLVKNGLTLALDVGDPLNELIFNLNQSAERFYAGILLVHTGYKPKTHQLKAYRKYSKDISLELTQVFLYPIGDIEEKRLFKILNDSYLDSRYKDDYFISAEDLGKLIFRVEELERVAINICTARIETLA